MPDDRARCPGGTTLLGKPLGICVPCTRRTDAKGDRTPHITPQPRQEGGRWVCDLQRLEG